MPILLDNGVQQLFRLRHHDIVLRGMLDDAVPPVRARFRLNDADERPFHVEELPDRDTDWVNGYKSTPAELRCRELGEICVEIPVADSALRAGRNRLLLRTDDAGGHAHELTITFDWDATALPLPLDLRDLTRFTDIQEVGQALNGAFDLDRKRNVIRSRAPVAPDAYLILGSPHESQEATYAVRFLEPAGAKWLGLSDFMAGQEEGVPARGVKVGWSSAGMAAHQSERRRTLLHRMGRSFQRSARMGHCDQPGGPDRGREKPALPRAPPGALRERHQPGSLPHLAGGWTGTQRLALRRAGRPRSPGASASPQGLVRPLPAPRSADRMVGHPGPPA